MMILKPEDKPLCIHCGNPLDDKADDYAIAGRTGPASIAKTDCGWCDMWFTAERLDNGDIVMKKATAPHYHYD